MIVVTAGIIESQGKFLIAKRKPGKDLAGYWELPGGKLESNEDPRECLERELLEELSINTKALEFIGESIHDYTNKTVKLLAYRVRIVSGEIKLLDHDEVAWISIADVGKFKIAPADLPILGAYALGKSIT